MQKNDTTTAYNIAAYMIIKYAREHELAQGMPTHKLFARTGMYDRIDEAVSRLEAKYAKRSRLSALGELLEAPAQRFISFPITGGLAGLCYAAVTGNLETASSMANDGFQTGLILGTCDGVVYNGFRKLTKISGDVSVYRVAAELEKKNPAQAEKLTMLHAYSSGVATDLEAHLNPKGKAQLVLLEYISPGNLGIHNIVSYIFAGVVSGAYALGLNYTSRMNMDKSEAAIIGIGASVIDDVIGGVRKAVRRKSLRKLNLGIEQLNHRERQALVGALVSRWYKI